MRKWFNTSANLVIIDQMVVSGVNFFLGLVLARFLGVRVFGFFSMCWLILLFFSAIFQAAIISPMMSIVPFEHVSYREKYDTALLCLAFLIDICIFLFVVVCFAFSYYFSSSFFQGIPFCLSWLIFVFLMQDFIRKKYLTQNKEGLSLGMDLIAYVGSFLGIVIIYFLRNFSLNRVIFTMSCFFTLSLIFGMIYYSIGAFKKKYFKFIVVKYWRFSKWLVWSALLQWFSGNLFTVMGGYILGVWVLGVVRICQSLMGVLHVLFLAMENIVPARCAVLLKKEGRKAMLSYMKRIAFSGISICFIMFLFAWVFNKQIFELIYGQQYVKYAFMLNWFVIIYSVMFFAFLARYILRAYQNTKHIFLAYIFSASFSLVFSYPIIKMFHLSGVALGTLLTQLIMFGWYVFKINQRGYIKP